MRKIYFSVWPQIEGDDPMPECLRIINEKSQAVMKNSGYDTCIRTDIFIDDKYMIAMGKYAKKEKRYYSRISDYLRVKMIIDYFKDGYDEVMYGDVDMAIILPPLKDSYGVGYQINLETFNNDGTGDITKLWSKGSNCVMRLNKYHLPNIEEVYELICKEIISTKGKPLHSYPMKLLWPLEDDIGYVAGMYMFGSLKQRKFCTPEKIIMSLAWRKFQSNQDVTIRGYNCMGSFDLDGVEEEAKLIFSLDLDNFNYKEELKKLANIMPDNMRIRPNYNTTIHREMLKNDIKTLKELYKGKSDENCTLRLF